MEARPSLDDRVRLVIGTTGRIRSRRGRSSMAERRLLWATSVFRRKLRQKLRQNLIPRSIAASQVELAGRATALRSWHDPSDSKA